jgi:hypothetical protein
MALTEDYRDQAAECRRIAETEADEMSRSVWLLLQNAWMRLSDDAPKMLKPAPGPKAMKAKAKRAH